MPQSQGVLIFQIIQSLLYVHTYISFEKRIKFGFTFEKRFPNQKKYKLNHKEMVLSNPSKESMIMLIV